MLDFNNINLVIFIVIVLLSIFRFLKKLIHIAFLLAPPIIFSIYTKSNFLTNLAFWFICTDFIFNHLNKVTSLFKALFLPSRRFSSLLIGKLLNCTIRAISLYLIIQLYIQLFLSIISANTPNILAGSVFYFISISIVSISSNFLLKLPFIKTKKGTAL